MYPFFSLGLLFLVIALVAYAVGARGTAGMSAGIGRMLLIIGLILTVVFFVAGAFRPAGWAW